MTPSLPSLSGQRGASLVDFALAAPLFFFVVFGIIEFGRYMFIEHTLRYATQEGARTGQMGIFLGSPPVTAQKRLDAILAKIQTSAQNAVNPANLQISLYVVTQPDFTDPPPTTNTPGAAGDYMKLKVSYTFSFIIPFIRQFFTGGQLVLTSSVLYKNEPFDQ
jgi:hypothetical protein